MGPTAGAVIRFDGRDPSKYPAWKRWARAWMMAWKARGIHPASFGPELFTFLIPESPAAEACKDVNMMRLATDGDL